MIALIGSIGNREVKAELIFTVMGIGMRNKREVAERSEAGGSGKNQIYWIASRYTTLAVAKTNDEQQSVFARSGFLRHIRFAQCRLRNPEVSCVRLYVTWVGIALGVHWVVRGDGNASWDACFSAQRRDGSVNKIIRGFI